MWKAVLACGVVCAFLPACRNARERAGDLVLAGEAALATGDIKGANASFEEALRLVPADPPAQVGRAKALEKMGDVEKAFDSLAKCEDSSCQEERHRLAEGLIKDDGKPPFSDQASLQRFLRLSEAVRGSRCAMITAIARTDAGDVTRRKLLADAVRGQIEVAKRKLPKGDAGTPPLKMARELGAAAGTANDCDAADKEGMRMLGNLTVLNGNSDSIPDRQMSQAAAAFDLGLLSTELSALARSPKEMQALAEMPLRSPPELNTYLDAMQKAGYQRDCAVFNAILRAERFPAKQRAAVKAPLGAAIAALAPTNGAKDTFKIAGRKAPLDSIASGAQSCEELESLYNESAAAAAKIQALIANGADGEGTDVKVDRVAFIYTALRTRFEQPMSKKDIQDHDDLLKFQKR
jgi:tetratricopeptide (TPR) repeat protein